jgi:hypothetical protein
MLHENKSVQGQTEIANLLSARYGERVGMAFNRQLIQRWRAGRFLPVGIEPFPRPDDGNRYHVRKCCAWMENFIAARKKNPALVHAEEIVSEAKARRERARANREERADKREAGQFIERAVAERDAIGIVQRLHNACTVEDEQEIPSGSSAKLKELGVTWEIIAQHSAWLVAKKQEITARRVAAFHAATEEYLKTIPAGE